MSLFFVLCIILGLSAASIATSLLKKELGVYFQLRRPVTVMDRSKFLIKVLKIKVSFHPCFQIDRLLIIIISTLGATRFFS